MSLHQSRLRAEIGGAGRGDESGGPTADGDEVVFFGHHAFSGGFRSGSLSDAFACTNPGARGGVPRAAIPDLRTVPSGHLAAPPERPSLATDPARCIERLSFFLRVY